MEIRGSAGSVWSQLTRFDAYPAWNPLIRRIEGEAVVGSRLVVAIQLPGARAMTFRPVVLVAEQERELRWRGRLVLPGLFDGEHVFEIRKSGGGVRFVQREIFSGLLVPLLFSRMAERTRTGFERMNHALKGRVEASDSG